MLIRRPSDIPSSEITPEGIYLNRRSFIRQAAMGTAALGLAPGALAACSSDAQVQDPRFASMKSELDEPVNSFEEITTYNNFYEFGTAKDDPAKNSGSFRPRPWTVAIEGHVNKPGNYQLEDFLSPSRMEDRVYRLRCVEAWSMVIPWNGVPLRKVLDRVQPTSSARYVAFETVLRPSEMPAQRTRILDWPYVEGLRMDEAWNDLTLLSTGLYGRDLLNQNGAPIRLVVPWKYGFKSIKSIVRISFVEEMPPTTWSLMAPHEYGFFANVNPTVDHPRWSQARERRITGARLFSPGWFEQLRQRPTEMFNGYAEQVAHMYAGMDLRRWY
jgi:methionine sulfoxide reductase catalytic subunit